MAVTRRITAETLGKRISPSFSADERKQIKRAAAKDGYRSLSAWVAVITLSAVSARLSGEKRKTHKPRRRPALR